MKKNEAQHYLNVFIFLKTNAISAKCSYVAGLSGYCHHIIGILFYLAHCKQLGLSALPDELTCTSMKQRWSIPRGKKIAQNEIQDVMVKKPQIGADYSRFIKSNLYSPAQYYDILTKEQFLGLDPEPLVATLLPSNSQIPQIPTAACKFGNVPKGSLLSYQQSYSVEYVINDYTCTAYPDLPLETSGDRFENNFSLCLDKNKQALLDSLDVIEETVRDIHEKTVSQATSAVWHLLRKKRITASKFGLVAKRIGNFEMLVKQLSSGKYVQTAAMKRGIDLEPRAATIYAQNLRQNTVNLFPSGLIINTKSPWLGCSPDRKVYDLSAVNSGQNPFGLLEIKVVKEGETNFCNVGYLELNPVTGAYSLKRNHIYFYQVQCQLGLTGLQWCDFFSYINDSLFICDRIIFDKEFFQEAKDKVDIFFSLIFCNNYSVFKS
eukprot:gene15520-6783_t